jgi:hypothetical protein
MALDTLFFDLKINDMTDEQIKAIKSRLEKQLGANLDIGKQIQQSVNKGGGVKVKVGADTTVVEASLRRIKEIMNQPSMTAADRNEMLALSKVIKNVSAEKTKKDVQKVAEETSNVHTIKIDNRDSNVINLLKNNLEVAWQKAIALENELKGIYNSGKNINGDSSLRNYVKRISEELYNARNSVVGLESALSSMSKMNGSVVINDKMSDFETKKQAAELEQRKRVWKQWAEEQDKADRAASESARKQALAQAELAREQAKAVRQLVSITGDLRNQIGMLISAYTVEHLLKNVVEIGGEFEKQKLAMGSMLGSLEQADDIFNRMKNLALTSPFNFKDLSNYSRQLTAFGTPYKDLYDTTNRLADISAGLGGDMSRLVLAFSQVKAAAYLRGFDFMATLCGNTEDITPLIAGTPRKGQSAAKYAIAA